MIILDRVDSTNNYAMALIQKGVAMDGTAVFAREQTSGKGRRGRQWILIDYVNVVVHIMLPEPRKFYKLEEMWNDATIVEH